MRLLRVPEVAERLALGTSTEYALIDRGDLPHVRFGRAIRVAGGRPAGGSREGSVERGRVAQISFGGRDDRRIVRRIRPTKRAAKAALADLLRPAEPVPPQREQPLGAYLRRWLDESAAPSLSPSTLRGYRDALAHLAPIADIPIGSPNPRTSRAPWRA